jgi:NADPH:quinone reductase-like Zn-dependent oxidoreductase
MLVRVHAAGVGIWDVGILSGQFDQALPSIPGCEVAGTVEVPAGAFSAGDPVFCPVWESLGGGFAEIAAAPVTAAASIPEGIGYAEAAGLVISAGTAYQGMVDRGKVQAGETVLVTAASGGVGTAAVQIARSLGARVVAVASARNHDYVRELGADAAVDYHDSAFVEQLRSAALEGFDVLFDGTGNQVRDQVLGLIRDGGRGIFIVGGTPPARQGVEFQSFVAKTSASTLEAVAKLAASGKLRMPIEAEFPLERAREALEHVAAKHTVGGAALRIG